ncbi:MAG: energy transducer TonB [Proteobacteria bacterium]|nr:energy transducer TonB [Pseudomonadota bacterium]
MRLKYLLAIVFLFFVLSVYAQEEIIEEVQEDTVQPTARPSWATKMPERQNQPSLKRDSFKEDLDLDLDMSDFIIDSRPPTTIMLEDSTSIDNVDESDSKEISEPVVEEIILLEEKTQADVVSVEEEIVVDELIEDTSLVSIEAEEVQADMPAVDDTTDTEVVLETPQEEIKEQEVDDPIEETSVVSTNEIEETPVVNTNEIEETIESPVVESWLDFPIDEEEAVDDVSKTIEDSIPVEHEEIATENYPWIVKKKAVRYPRAAIRSNLSGWVEVHVIIAPDGSLVSATAKKFSRRGRVFVKNSLRTVKSWQFEPPSYYGVTTNISRIFKIVFTL